MNFADINLKSLKIIHYPNPVLRKVAEEITDFDEHLANLATRMLEIMKKDRGVGLAAPQVGLSIRLFVCNPTGNPEDNMVCVNPILSDFSGGEEMEEGCLSLPEVCVNVSRPTECTLTAYDVQGNKFTHRAEGLLTRIWQHENDHLDGKLLLDRMNTQDKLSNQKAVRNMESDYERAVKRSKRKGLFKKVS